MKPGGLVLVVEDDLEIRESLLEILEESGFHAQSATNGREALTKLRAMTVKPSLILMDLMMPVMDGLAFRREQLADPTLADIPAVLISAHSNVKDSCEDLRFSHHLRKPIDLDELLAIAADHCAPA